MINKNSINLKSRREKIIFNISRLISENNITQKKFCEDLGYDGSLISKWKNGASTPSLEMIDAIAKYFNVSPHEIYYSPDELEKIAIKSSGTYRADNIKENIVIRDYSEIFQPWVAFVIPPLVIVILIYIMFCFQNANVTLIFTSVIYFILTLSFRIVTVTRYRFIINYLDCIYYKIDDNIFKYSLMTKIFGIISLIAVISSVTVAMLLYGISIFTLLFVTFAVIFAITTLCYLVQIEKNMQEKLGDYEFSSPFKLMYSLSSSSILLAFSIFGCWVYNESKLFISLLCCLCAVGLHIVSYILYMKKCKEYYLVIENEDGEVSKLKLK